VYCIAGLPLMNNGILRSKTGSGVTIGNYDNDR